MTDFSERRHDGNFQREVIDRLARIEEKHDSVMGRLDKAETNIYAHDTRLADHDREIAKAKGMAAAIAAGVGTAVGAGLEWLKGTWGK